ncbi:MAG: diguanylate cyclase [Calditrichota bacterium]
MAILLVDDKADNRLLLKRILEKGEVGNVLTLSSAEKALDYLDNSQHDPLSEPIDLILMDFQMPEINGIEACRIIQAYDYLKDIPVIMVTANEDLHLLEEAFESGAVDFLQKPVNKIELLARSKAALRLKAETDKRKKRENELLKVTTSLEQANRQLHKLSATDGLTDVHNRRKFDEYLDREWKRATRDTSTLTLVLIDIDHFKLFNDTYGHPAGDICLKSVAGALSSCLNRPGDFLARYGGEEFAVILPQTDIEGAMHVAEALRLAVKNLQIPHESSPTSDHITVSVGFTENQPRSNNKLSDFIAIADHALYEAKSAGRDRTMFCQKIQDPLATNG